MHIVEPSLTDTYLLEEIIKISSEFNCKLYIETGTHVGGSAKIASKYFDRVITCENETFYFEKAVENLKDIKNIELYFKSSTELFAEIFPLNERAIIFLDAHGIHDFPLLSELKLCENNIIKPIIVIHDFFVPDENGNNKFQYDTWNGNIIDINYVYPSLCNIYGAEDKFKYHFLDKQQISGVLYVIPTS